VRRWLREITSSPDDFECVADAILHFESEYDVFCKKIADAKGAVLVKVASEIPDMTLKVHDRWAELNAIYDVMELRKAALVGQKRKHFIEHYQRTLNSQQVEKYAESDAEVLVVSEVLIEIDFVRSKWEGLSKSLERLHHQLRSIMEMRRAGLEEATI